MALAVRGTLPSEFRARCWAIRLMHAAIPGRARTLRSKHVVRKARYRQWSCTYLDPVPLASQSCRRTEGFTVQREPQHLMTGWIRWRSKACFREFLCSADSLVKIEAWPSFLSRRHWMSFVEAA